MELFFFVALLLKPCILQHNAYKQYMFTPTSKDPTITNNVDLNSPTENIHPPKNIHPSTPKRQSPLIGGINLWPWFFSFAVNATLGHCFVCCRLEQRCVFVFFCLGVCATYFCLVGKATRQQQQQQQQPTNKPTNQPTNQPTNLPTYQPTNLPTYQPTNQLKKKT